MTSFLHTWGQQINHYIHLHCIVKNNELLNTLMKKEWVVYCKPPLPTGKPVLNYLSQYTFKIARLPRK
ncbi:MAG: transposase [Pseudomonadales bacterium]|nr:transposase [Pseudomonadales bacterium]